MAAVRFLPGPQLIVTEPPLKCVWSYSAARLSSTISSKAANIFDHWKNFFFLSFEGIIDNLEPGVIQLDSAS